MRGQQNIKFFTNILCKRKISQRTVLRYQCP